MTTIDLSTVIDEAQKSWERSQADLINKILSGENRGADHSTMEPLSLSALSFGTKVIQETGLHRYFDFLADAHREDQMRQLHRGSVEDRKLYEAGAALARARHTGKPVLLLDAEVPEVSVRLNP